MVHPQRRATDRSRLYGDGSGRVQKRSRKLFPQLQQPWSQYEDTDGEVSQANSPLSLLEITTVSHFRDKSRVVALIEKLAASLAHPPGF